MCAMTEPLSCPWCGDAPDVRPGDDFGCTVLCDNRECPVDVSVWGPTEAEAIATWNTRVEYAGEVGVPMRDSSDREKLERKVRELEGMLGELPPEGKCAMLLVQHVGGEYVWACERYDFASYVVFDVETDTYTGKVFSDPFGKSDFVDKLSVAELLRRAAAELDETGDVDGVMDMQERLIDELEVERDEWKAKAEMYRRQLGEMSTT